MKNYCIFFAFVESDFQRLVESPARQKPYGVEETRVDTLEIAEDVFEY